MTTTWFDGALRPSDEARPSAMAHTLHYGVGVFEGVRCYRDDHGGGAVFRLHDHLRRLEDSARVCGLTLPYTHDELVQACVDLLNELELNEAYLRPVVWQDDGTLGGLGANPPVHVAVIANPWGAYLGDDGLAKGIRCKLSAWRRGGYGSFMGRAKINGQYVASTLAKREALTAGYDEALLCDDAGTVCEGTGENLFLVRDGVLITPPESAAILPGITRDTVLTLARKAMSELGLEHVREQLVTRDLLLTADEVFLTGTAAEVTPVREIDGVTIGAGSRGPVTAVLQSTYFDVVHGRRSVPDSWLTPLNSAPR